MDNYFISFGLKLIFVLFSGLVDDTVKFDRELPSEKPAIVSEAVSSPVRKLQVPDFVTSVPDGHFAGVSAPSSSLTEARKSAVSDVVRQVLSTIGIAYDLSYIDQITGSPNASFRHVDDRLSGKSTGFVIGAEKQIVESSWLVDSHGRYVYFILVAFSDSDVAEMRRLSKGAKVVASVESVIDNRCRIRVSESNGVAVTLISAEIRTVKRNRFAKAISYYVVHVPEGSEGRVVVSLEPVRVCNGATSVSIVVDRSGLGFGGYLLGAKARRSITLKGFDELGQEIVVKAN